MAYRPPDFNLLANLWVCDLTIRPADGPPDYENVPCQKYVASRAAWPVTPPAAAGFYLLYHPPVQLRFQHAGQFSGAWPTWKVTCVECPAGSGQYYRVFWQDVQHEGFVNEYALVIGAQCNADLFAVPPPGGGEATGIGPDACGSTPPPPGDAFTDHFTDTPGLDLALHVADSGETWAMGLGEIDIGSLGTTVETNIASAGFAYYVADYFAAVPTEYALIIDTPSDISTGLFGALIYRAIAVDTWHAVGLQWDGFTGWMVSFWEMVGGSSSLLQTGTAVTSLAPDTEYVLRLHFLGSTAVAQLWTGGTLIDSQTMTDTVNVGAPGLGVWGYCDTGYPSAIFNALGTDGTI